MNDQQLTLITDEQDKPQPVWTNTAIKQMLNELTEIRRQRNERAEQAESWFRVAQQLQGQVADLTAKLAATNAELHDLRIRWGMDNHE